MTEPSDYYLGEDALRARFEQRVRQRVFAGFEPQKRPVLVLLGGQPAAGKSMAMAATQQRHSSASLVPLTGDELRSLHPRYAELRHVDAQTRETATAQASGAWVRMSIEYAMRERYSLILEGVFRDPTMTLRTGQTFAEAGYRVEIVALAVREERSRLDAVDRFLDGGRWTPPALQDLAYGKVPETVAAAEADPAFRRITITNRSGTDLYTNERHEQTREWMYPPAAVRALTDERARPFPPEEAAEWLPMYRTVTVQMAARLEVNDASRPVLERLAENADAVALMTGGDPTSPDRTAHEATKPLLQTMRSHSLTEAVLPALLRPDSQLDPTTDRTEIQRRAALPPTARAHESRTREQFASARHRHHERNPAHVPDAPSVTASRSTPTSMADTVLESAQGNDADPEMDDLNEIMRLGGLGFRPRSAETQQGWAQQPSTPIAEHVLEHDQSTGLDR
ncbi:zeta toxin family protein [Streptomyces sp. NPDC096136]|uniref:zeta toxin family protein n=1 Tax=Streptomyces sp. NPDC096136 TaxID=3366076 RepID=UPI00381B749B